MGRMGLFGGLSAVAALVLSCAAPVRGDDGADTGTAVSDVVRPLSLMQVVNPADQQAAPPTAPAAAAPVPHERLRTYEMPPVTVVGQTGSGLREEDRVGSYAQPRWTADRRFPETRVYVIPEGKVEFEYWERVNVPRSGPTNYQSLYELEIGLPYRLQLDLYFRTDHLQGMGKTLTGQQFEVRWALADWGKIWGNPTFYFEYTALEDRSDAVEGKLLLGGELAPRWHWGLNFVGEFEVSGSLEHNFEVTGGLSYTVIDEKLSVGGEFKASASTERGHRWHFDAGLLLGPSIQYRPLPQVHLDFAPLIGVTGGSEAAEIFVVVGYEF